jgi:hypothetical protein
MTAAVRNIGPAQRRRRRVRGVVMLGVAVAALVALETLRAERGWRLALFVPFWLAALGVFQANAET